MDSKDFFCKSDAKVQKKSQIFKFLDVKINKFVLKTHAHLRMSKKSSTFASQKFLVYEKRYLESDHGAIGYGRVGSITGRIPEGYQRKRSEGG